ncbi:MAG: hypothetical protein IJ193_02870 [Bacilli bacterium]|nr:hypothetical protein [Bacilli bacterium]
MKKVFSRSNLKWLALLIIIIILAILFSFQRDIDVVEIKNRSLYQYLTGIKVEYKGTIHINKNKDEITKLSFKDQVIELDTTPIYYKGEKRVLFPKNMAVIYPLRGIQYKINYYSEIYEDYTEFSIKDGSLDKRLFDAIIYDGGDIYFLTEKSTVTFGDKKYELDPLSYVIVDTLNNTVSVYDYTNDKFDVLEEVRDQVIITNGKYKVNASLDLMYYNDTSKLFIKDVSKLMNLPKKD